MLHLFHRTSSFQWFDCRTLLLSWAQRRYNNCSYPLKAQLFSRCLDDLSILKPIAHFSSNLEEFAGPLSFVSEQFWWQRCLESFYWHIDVPHQSYLYRVIYPKCTILWYLCSFSKIWNLRSSLLFYLLLFTC